jgi:hypothetical protein
VVGVMLVHSGTPLIIKHRSALYSGGATFKSQARLNYRGFFKGFPTLPHFDMSTSLILQIRGMIRRT